jgi:hypothetical protein
MVPTVVAVAAVARTKARIRARKNRQLLPANVQPVSLANKSPVKAARLANSANSQHRVQRIVLRMSSLMTKWITSATVLIMSVRTRARTRVAAVVPALRHQVLQPQQAQRLAHVVRAQAARVPVPVQPPAHLLPSAMVHAVAHLVTARPAAKSNHAIGALPVMISQHVRSLQSGALVMVSQHRRSCTKSRKAIASRPPNNSINCQAAHAVKNRHC